MQKELKLDIHKALRNKHNQGFTLMEILIVIAIIAIISVGSWTNWLRQIQKAHDSRKKTDLNSISKAFEEYFNDHQEYPPTNMLTHCGGDDLAAYGLKRIPCDPEGDDPYLYQWVDGANSRSGYRVYTQLTNTNDGDIEKLNCDGSQGCGVSGQTQYNYGVSAGAPVSQK